MTIAAEEIKRAVTQVERLLEEKKDIQDAIKDVLDAAKSNGLEPKAIKAVIKLRARKPQEIEEEEILIDLYKQALGM